MKKEPSISAEPRLRELIPLLWNKLGSSKLLFSLAIFLCLCQLGIDMIIPYVLELYFNMLDAGDINKVSGVIITFNVVFLTLTGLGLLGHYLRQNNMSILHRVVTLDLADHAQRLPLENASASHSADLSQRIMWDSNKVTQLLVTIFNHMGSQILLLLFACAYMLTLHWQVAVGAMILMPLSLLGSHLLRHRLARIAKEVADQESAVKQSQQDALQNMDMLRAYNARDWMTERFVAERRKLNALYMRRMWWQQLVHTLSVTSALLIAWGTILFVAWLAVQNKIQLGALMAFFVLVWRVYNPLLNLGRLWGEAQEAKGAAARLATLWRALKEPSDRNEPNGIPASVSEELHPGIPILSWKNILFQYEEHASIQLTEQAAPVSEASDPAAAPLLQQFDLDIRQASFTAIVGPSGSGKSTVAKLGAGLLFPQRGIVEICGSSSLRDAEQARRSVAYVPQNPYLFAGTIRDNLRLARPGASDEELVEAARAAEAHAFIQSLPDGYDTLLSEHGSSLSGGQRQRLAIARAMLADRPVWILDEATSALDTETERRVMDNILKRAKQRGSALLVIAHRLSTVQEADTIIAMENGEIVEQGTHGELLAPESGVYGSLWRQMEGDRPEPAITAS
ncbi:ABC transporter ATP-binding protein [Paenibacillus soyae]|uniref:ABC transporter ATP-binding protein/permease n=1 Tax=Paenibacillus soyae TaxID=2969249 RepID=A0A9X2MXV7_9BACL|nr:ABC transporter ATP-binding protein [Paenibacillus soyae]MCR2807888.1 ABC transporter ATP-binding protein/permease [Paenibacillus soyae]